MRKTAVALKKAELEELRIAQIKLSNNAKIFANEHYDYHKHFSKLENIMQMIQRK